MKCGQKALRIDLVKMALSHGKGDPDLGSIDKPSEWNTRDCNLGYEK